MNFGTTIYLMIVNLASENNVQLIMQLSIYTKLLTQRNCGDSVCLVFLDFAKAFDYVNHEKLLNKLEHHWVRGVEQDLISLYLSCRYQYTSNKSGQYS